MDVPGKNSVVRTNKSSRPIVLAFFLVLQGSGLFAVDITLQPGFSGLFPSGAWVPLAVRLQNDGPRARGELILELVDETRAPEERLVAFARRRMDIPAGDTRTARFSMPVSRQGLLLSVRLEDAGRVLASRQEILRSRTPARTLLVVASRSAGFDFIRKLLLPRDRLSEIAYTHPELLPDLWLSYGGVRYIILHDVSYFNMTEEQVFSLNAWVERGGVLLISGGAHLSPAQAGKLALLLPGRVAGLVSPRELRSSGALAQTAKRLGKPLTRLVQTRGERLVGEASLPLLVRELRGRGAVYFSAMDASAVLPQMPGSFWQDFVARGSPAASIPLSFDERAEESVLYRPLLMKVLPGFGGKGAALLYVAVWLAVHALLFFLTRRWKQNLWWRIAGIVTISLTAVLFLNLRYGESHPQSSSVFLVQRVEGGSGQQTALVRNDLLWFSRFPSAFSFRLDPEGVLFDTYGSKVTRIFYRDTLGREANVQRFSLVMFRELSQRTLNLPISARTENGSMVIGMDAGAGREIEDAVLLWNGAFLPAGTLVPGRTLYCDPASPSAFKLSDGNPDYASLFRQPDQLRELVFSALVQELLAGSISSEVPLLIGWLKPAAPALSAEGEQPPRTISLILFRLNRNDGGSL